MNRELDELIRERAYAIWEEEGRPDGEEFRHWLRAVEEIRIEHGDDSSTTAMAAGAGLPTEDKLKTEEGPAQSQPADALHAAPMPGATAAPVAQGTTRLRKVG